MDINKLLYSYSIVNFSSFNSLRLIEGNVYSLFYVYILMRNLLVLRNDNRYGGTTDRNSREIFSKHIIYI